MKNPLSHLLPALALLTLGGCASTGALSTTENDGVYYSSQDRTTQNASASVAGPAEQVLSDGEISNPDYATQGQSSSGVTESTEYYDDDYAYSARIRRFHQPYYRGFGYGYNDFMYADPFWYGGSSYYGNGFYDPFWGPSYGYGGLGGSFVNINIGFGSPWGWGYNPWRYGRGYGYGGYDAFGYGGYGYGGLGYGYGGLGYGGYNYYNSNNSYYGGVSTPRNVRGRNNPSTEAGTVGRTGVGTGNAVGSRSRAATGGVANPTSGRTATGGIVGGSTAQPTGRGRSRVADGGNAGGISSEVISTGQPQVDQLGRARSRNSQFEQLGSNRSIDQVTGGNATQPATYERSRRRVVEAAGTGTTDAATRPQYTQPRRSRFSELSTTPSSSGQAVEQPTRRQRTTYEAPQRTYEAPQRTYEAPSRSYEAPSRSSSPSMGGGSMGGGNSGGGGRGRGRN